MLPAGALVAELLGEYHLGEDIRRYRVFTDWTEIVGPRLAARTWPTPIRDGVLRIRVANSSWLHQLSFMQDQLLEQINRHLGEPALVTELRMFLGRRGRREQDELDPHTAARFRVRRRPRRPLPPPATGADLAAIDAETAAAIEDEELRAVIREARRRLGG
ncbi:DciA family protein [Haliangium sp.]|uniref:DciA family protein n=1 Tax=Haliangium sp. TaxID=2663208 RepID=UPI003D13A51B